MKINKKKIEKVINQLSKIKRTCASDIELIFMVNALDEAERRIGWAYAKLLEGVCVNT